MKYVALLRGINVGGNNIIKMADLKACMEKSGYKKVVTFIQSGNVIFESSEKEISKVTAKLEKLLSKTFSYKSKVVIISHTQMKKVVDGIPKAWLKRKDIRFYIAFVRNPYTVKDVLADLKPKKGVDEIITGPGVVYLISLIKKLTSSGLNKIAGTKSYKEITIRNKNTTMKLLALMTK